MKKKPPEIETGSVRVYSVSPVEEDHVALDQILTHSKRTHLKFKVEAVPTLASALAVLQKSRIPIVVSERDLSPGSWKDLLDHSARLPVPPLLIVTSRLADDRLWSEALNFGAWDVLAKPFEAQEVCRVVEGAWLRWRNQHQNAAKVTLASATGAGA
jgi:DNA-binding response OmpR family regulator